MTKEAKILIAIAIVVLIGGVLLAIYANPKPAEPGKAVDSKSLVRDNSHMTGKAGAKVTMVEFGDYQCPGCAAAHPIVKEVLAAYKDNPDFNFVFRNFPLDELHPNAHIGAEAAEEAATQGKFWEMHNLLYEKQKEWSTSQDVLGSLVAYASVLGLNAEQFKTHVSQQLAKDVISADMSDGNALGINSTPTFFINGEQIIQDTIPTADELKAKIDEQLKK